MAVRINLRKTDKPTPKFDAVFSGDRTEALASMASATPAADVVDAAGLAGQTPSPAPGEGRALPAGSATPAPDMAASAMALRMVHAAANAPVPVAAAAGPTVDGEPVVEEASEAILHHSSKPATIKALAIVFKWSLFVGVLLGGGYYVMRHVFFPVAAEMQKARTAPVAVDKNASSLVQAVQQARVTVAKNNTKVDYLNEIIEGPKAAPKPLGAETLPPKSAVLATTAKDLSDFHEAIAALNIGAVTDGETPRLFIDGLIIKPGDFVSRPLGLVFVGVDANERVLLFGNKESQFFKKPY